MSCQNTEKQSNSEIEISPLPSVKYEEDSLSFNADDYKWEEGYIVLDWAFLSRIKYEDGYVNKTTKKTVYHKDIKDNPKLYAQYEGDTLVMLPVFHDDIKVLNGKPIQIHGYLIPLEDKTGGKMHFLSAYPMSQCFFCGAAGPESLMDVLTKKPYKGLKMDDKLTFRGTLHLNDSDLDYMNYVLKDAILVK